MKILLIVIYLAFISLGLPDSLLGSAWPAMRAELGAPVPTAGWLAMTISLGTIISSLFSNKIITRFKTGKVTAVSVAMTAAALFGFAFAPSVWFLFLMAVPLGLGAGSIDAGLNNFVALHYKSSHMNWLHCFWGIGATVGPMIMAYHIAAQNGWRYGYITIAAIQAILVVILFASLGLWRNGTAESSLADNNKETRYITNREALRLPNARLAMMGFIFFSATEGTTGLWCSSYLSLYHGFSAADAATVASCFYGGITVGRLISGFISMRVKSPDLIRWGQLTCVAGALLIILPLSPAFAVAGIVLIGLGTSPVFPAMLHETPNRFGKDVSQAIVGLEMAVAYIGGTTAAPLFGQLASVIGIRLFPYFLLGCILIMLVSSELLQKRIRRTEKGESP
jgi:fucose permease